MSLFPSLEFVGRYRLILADNPWLFQNYGQAKHGAARSHYDGLTVEQLCSIPVGELADPTGCVLLMWCTAAHEVEGAHTEVIRAWGHRPVTRAFYWRKVYAVCTCGHGEDSHAEPGYVRGDLLFDRKCKVRSCGCGRYVRKPYVGCGSYTRQGGECCWQGLKGSMPVEDRNVLQEVEAVVREHSVKPREVFERIDQAWPDATPRLELFCRGKPREGWDGWGDECIGGVDVFGPEIGQSWPVPKPQAAPETLELFAQEA